MMYYNFETGEIKSRDDIKKLFPNASLKQDFEEFEGWFKLYDGELPVPDNLHKIEEDGIYQIDGKWTKKYKLVELSEFEVQKMEKEGRYAELDRLTVNVGGMEFDADEIAQGRMHRAVIAHADDEDGVIFKWVLANNNVAEIGVDILKEALKKAVKETGKLWVKVYE